MAKAQTFGDKVRKRKEDRVQMAKLVVAERKHNGSYRFREKIVPVSEVQAELKSAQ